MEFTKIKKPTCCSVVLLFLVFQTANVYAQLISSERLSDRNAN